MRGSCRKVVSRKEPATSPETEFLLMCCLSSMLCFWKQLWIGCFVVLNSGLCYCQHSLFYRRYESPINVKVAFKQHFWDGYVSTTSVVFENFIMFYNACSICRFVVFLNAGCFLISFLNLSSWVYIYRSRYIYIYIYIIRCIFPQCLRLQRHPSEVFCKKRCF